MKRLPIFLIIMMCFTLNVKLTAQPGKQISDFIDKTDNYLETISENTTDINIAKGISGRKVKVKGNFDNDTKSFKQTIKYFKNGNKKETITVKYYGTAKSYFLLRVVLFNDEYFYIKSITYSMENKIKKVADEELIDGKIYQKAVYNNSNKQESQQYYWILNRD